MAKLEIRIYDDPVLRERAAPIEIITDEHRRLAEDMQETMYGARGIGLAANQVGRAERIIVVDVGWGERDGRPARPPDPKVMLNPEVLEASVQDASEIEGCLSLPEIEGDIWRPVGIRYRYQDLDGRWHEAEARDLEARCILHEIDHLNGVLMIDRMEPAKRKKVAGKLSALRRARTPS